MFKTHGFVANWELCLLVHGLSGGPVPDLLEDYDPSRSPVSYDVMYLPFLFIYGAMFGWDVPLWVDPLLLALFLLLQVMSPAPSLRTCPGHLGGRLSEFSTS